MVGDDDLVVRFVEVDPVRIGHPGFRPADGANGRVEFLRVAPEDDVHVRRLHRERHHVALRRKGDSPRLVRHVQQPLRRHVAARVVVEHDQAILDVVVDGEQLAVAGIHRHAGHEADAGVGPHDLLLRGRRLLRRGAAGGAVVDEQALAIRVAHHHEVVRRVHRDAVEARKRIDDHAHRRQVAAFGVAAGGNRDLLAARVVQSNRCIQAGAIPGGQHFNRDFLPGLAREAEHVHDVEGVT